MKDYLSVTILLLSCSYLCKAQSSFSVSPELVYAIKSADTQVFYNYAQFENHTNDTLQMRWVKTVLFTSNPIGQGGGHGGGWNTAVQDPQNFYNPANTLDSADFYLKPETGSTDKFILQLFPDGIPGELLVRFKLYPINDPNDSLIVTFDYTAFDPATGVNAFELNKTINVFPNPASDYFWLENDSKEKIKVTLLNGNGQLIRKKQLERGTSFKFDCSGMPRGWYYVLLETDHQFGIKRIAVK